MNIHEAFNGIALSNELSEALCGLSVDKIVVSKKTKDVTIFVSAAKSVHKKALFELSGILNKEVFKGSAREIYFEERYDFSEVAAEDIYEMNKENLCYELSMEGDLMMNIFKKTRLHFEGNKILMESDRGMIQKMKLTYIASWLSDVFLRRYKKPVEIEIVYREEKEETTSESEGMDFVSLEEIKAEKAEHTARMEKEKKAAEVSKPKVEAVKKETAPVKKQPFRKAFDKRLLEDPNLFYGRNFEGELTKIKDIREESDRVNVLGKIMEFEEIELRSGKSLFLIDITDFTDSIRVKLYVKPEEKADLKPHLGKGKFIKLQGISIFDPFDKEIIISSVYGIKKAEDFNKARMDTADEKRVELHLHTIMSEMNGTIRVKELLKTLSSWGHKAVAITDNGVVQSFAVANLEKKYSDMKDFKVIYGMNAYVVDDIYPTVRNGREQTTASEAVIFDIETTGFGPKNSRIIEIGAVKVANGKIIERFSSFVNPHQHIPAEITNLTSITDDMVMNEPDISVILPQFIDFIGDALLVAHNASFDTSFIYENMKRLGKDGDFTIIDTVAMSRVLLGVLKNYKLNTVAEELSITLDHHHRAVDDAEATAHIYIRLCEIFKEKFGTDRLHELNSSTGYDTEIIKKIRPTSLTVLAKNDIGRINLYHLVSISHLDNFMRLPRIKKSELLRYREGLLFGSGNRDGELYDALLRSHAEDEIERIVRFCDFLEVQPISNNISFIDDARQPDITSEADLREINDKIIALGEKYDKPVVATSDARFLHPEEEIFRKIILNADGKKEANVSMPLYLRTTDEMLEEFSYLGKDKAYEIVVRNTNLIADQIEFISPVRPDKCAPVIPHSDEELRQICEQKAKEMYGEELPPAVLKRMNHELDSIIKNGFAVMYIISQKLVWKSNEDGYLVGSRGSVGSSFVAFLSGITEVNSLPAHYYCEHCHFVDFDSEEVKAYSGRSGCDMPDRNCPSCGKPLTKDGHDIPFETFLGFNGDKEPDIDLNFSGEYQAKAHAYTEVIFGEGQTYRAGTIGGVADKTAFGYVLKYLEERDLKLRKAEILRHSLGCVGVRRTTGQHPGGIVVLPIGEDICSFTPIQHPANDMTTPIITTHFDYHSIDHNLLKLDILGHDDPTMIRMLEDMTGVDAKKIRLDDKGVLSLFVGLEKLQVEPKDIYGYDLGSLGVPEFGTDFVMQMLKETKPKSFSDLVRISGLSHGTDVWTGNAQKLIKEGICEISTAICTRDDIMIYLIDMGLEPGLAFKIMESVRKGKGLTPDWEAAMKEKNVPEWYIWSCNQIKYMFPKAHAVAYVMMGFRIAYFKVYHPLEYYTAFFSIRAKAFDYEKFCMGKDKLLSILNELHRIKREKPEGKSISKKEEDVIKDANIVLEMYARGFSFHKLDIYTAKPKQFQIIDGKIMPSLNSIEGLGDKAAYALYEAAKNGEFISKYDLKTRVKGLTQTTMEKMTELGILRDLPETNQISFMDFMNM